MQRKLRSGDVEQLPPESLAAYSPEGPVWAATDWLEAVLEQRDLRAAWPRTDPNLRLVFAQAWLWVNRAHPQIAGWDLDEAAHALAEENPQHELWDAFAQTQLGAFRHEWPTFNHTDWGAGSAPRPVSPGYELVVYFHTGGDVVVMEEDHLEPGIALLMRQTSDSWLVAGIQTDTPPTPGWPPSAPAPDVL